MIRKITVAALVLTVVWPLLAHADTIVLKNGRRILANSVTEDGDYITYETSAGELKLPKAIVARIDHNDLAPDSNTLQAPVSAPQVNPAEGYDDVAKGAVHDGTIDSGYLFRLDGEAKGGDDTAVAKMAAAHHFAAQYLVGKGQVEDAANQYRQALTIAPNNLGLLLNLAVIYLRQSEFTAAMDPLGRAQRVAPDSPDVPKLMGWAYYGENKIDRAVEQWNRSLSLRPDSEVRNALEKARRDQQEEESYREGVTPHFELKYNGEATPDLARDVLRSLEEDFRDIESQLDFTPPDRIGVILYTNQSFTQVTQAPDWAGAINDGRIRIPVQGLTSVNADLNRILRHELTHSFVTQKTRGRCPTWLQEGIAQWMEGRRSGDSAAQLIAAYDAKSAPSLAQMEGSWLGLPSNVAGFAYALALAAVESIIRSGGISDINRLLDQIASRPSTADALRMSLRLSYSDLDQQTYTYLRRQYM